ncbi:uncharacterized protein N7503_009918 [Penicillium pulvis]|uniref:uncharacterized protein n=1 Tax=Penicillium pulvis TaxID=1562058 RepID=UPI002547B331|nr:uncharacterized protein N7503_009918 [Penicillium pulvis]KAJ5784706.1 hypothetical protein N7503_009918 [Penicillium pulvis]
MTSISFGGTSSGFQLGVNHGQIILPAERGESRAKPISTVPLPHDPDFVSRDALLEQIQKKALIPGSRIALVGLGGVGKTQLAVEYCHQLQRQSPDTWILWVHASNVARCEKSLRELADRAKIPHDHNTNIFQVVGAWLQDEIVGQWVLVLDNVDDDELLRKPLTMQSNDSTQPPLRYLFQSSNGSIIVTSRNKGVALNIARHSDIIEVQPMNEAEALNLLQRKLSTFAEQKDMIQLVKALDYMPLAIVQAAAYITHHMPRCSVSKYLEKVQKSDQKAARLLDYEASLLHRDWEAKNSILVTWQISFDYIKQIQPSAADLLSLMSFYDRQGIQESLLRLQASQGNREISHLKRHAEESSEDEDTSSESEADNHFNDDITTLSYYALITVGEDNTFFTMHRLVQVTVRTWLKVHGQLEQWKEQFINHLYSEFPTGAYENWEKCRSLFPHIKSAESQRPRSEDSIQKWTSLLYRGAWYALDSGYIAESREMAYKSRAYRQKARGAEDEDTLTSTTILADIYRQEGLLEEAEQLHIQVMEARKTKLGADHPQTLSSIADLASTYRKQGRWDDAQQLDMQVLEGRKTKLGADHPDTLMSMANLSTIYWDQGRWGEAEQLQIHVLEAHKSKLGTDNLTTLSSIASLATTYGSQGRWGEAEQLQIQVVEARKLKLGADHPDTLMSMANLSTTYWDQGRWGEAEQLDLQVLETRQTKLGADHPKTLSSIANLATTYWSQGRWGEAEQLQIQVMEARKTKLGADHPKTLSSIADLATTYRKQGRWGEAEQLQIQVLEARKLKLSADHPDTLMSMAEIAFVWESTGRSAEAIDLLQMCMAKSQRILGPTHPSTLGHSKTLLKWQMKHLKIEE